MMERLLQGRLRRPIKLVYRRPRVLRRRPKIVPGPPPETLPREKIAPPTIDVNTAAKELFTAVTRVEPMLGISSSVNLPAAEAFQQLLADTRLLPSTGPTSSTSPIDAVVNRLKAQAVLPTVDLLNEAIHQYIEERSNEKALGLMETMTSTYGVLPNGMTKELMANLQLRTGNTNDAVNIFMNLPSVSPYGQSVINSTLLTLFKRNRDGEAWELFNNLRSKALPSPIVASTMLTRCGKLGHTEKAFLLNSQLTAQGMTPNAPCSTALILAASKRKEYYGRAMELFRQMDLLRLPVGLPVYNNLLYACGKVADLKTALALWERALTSAGLVPNEYTCCNFLWALAAVEVAGSKISKRNFVYDLKPATILEAVAQVRDYMRDQGIPMSAHTVSAFLAIYSNHGRRVEAEELFWSEACSPRTPYFYELMFKLYDNIKDYEAAVTVRHQLSVDKLTIPYEGWRALIRSAALCNKLEEALLHLREMQDQGYKPHLDDFATVLQRLYERDREDLAVRFKSICERKPGPEGNPYRPWLQRSQAVSRVLNIAYGDRAPKLATTKIHRKECKDADA